jgi:hypothetical protein
MAIVVYFTAADGTRYRVYDATFSNHKHHTRPIGDPTATVRVFVLKDGTERSYTFKPADSRVLEDQALERQLRAADN